MRRNLEILANKTYDLIVIGGGIYGACVAWDATLRGLSVVLVDKGDFGAATSANTLKIIHGGLRYLQQRDLHRMRQSIKERTIFLRIVPHLVHPLPFLIPTYGHFMRGKEIMTLALTINNVMSFDRNQLNDQQKYLPRGHCISKSECMELIPGLDNENLTGGATWYDCQVFNSERLVLSFLLSAHNAGADTFNYMEVNGFLKNGNKVIGVRAKDVLTEDEVDIRSKAVVNTTGPWANHLLDLLYTGSKHRNPLMAKAVNVVTPLLCQKYAIGVQTKNSRFFFITPWRNFSLIGTTYQPYHGNPDDFTVTARDIEDLIGQINLIYPKAGLTLEDVSFVHGGLLPIDNEKNNTGDVEFTRHFRILDHKELDGIDALITVISVKYTEARLVAQTVVDLLFKKLGKIPPKCQTMITPLTGGNMEQFDNFLSHQISEKPQGLNEAIIQHLVYSYGSEYTKIVDYLNRDPAWGQPVGPTTHVIKAEILYSVQVEMAQKLSDVIFRRTELGSAGNPGDKSIRTCATIMAAELGWNETRIQNEIQEVREVFSY